MDTRPYATPEGVEKYLSSLSGLHALRAERLAAAKRFETLPAFCVMGTYVLSADGRFGELTGVAARLPKETCDVVPLEEFIRRGRAYHGERWEFTYRMNAALAPHDRLCIECDQGWTYQQRADVIERTERRTCLLEDGVSSAEFLFTLSMHLRCHAAAEARDALWWAEDALDLAGFAEAMPAPCRPPKSGGIDPWFRVDTELGEIRFGCRPPGFGIDWSGTGRDLAGTFCRVKGITRFGPVWNDPPVDHGPHHVQPKHEGYLIEYLRRLRETLGL